MRTLDQPFGYQFCVFVLTVSWIYVYIAITRLGFRDLTYGMPPVALCGNLAWEFQFGFVQPYDIFQRAADVIWFLLDIGIAVTVLRYGARQFRTSSAAAFHTLLAIAAAFAFTAMPLLSRSIGQAASIYLGFADTLMMSALFIAMAVGRGTRAGQSLSIAYTKWIGTAFGIVAYVFFDKQNHGIALVAVTGVAIFVLDACYTRLLHRLPAKVPPHAHRAVSPAHT